MCLYGLQISNNLILVSAEGTVFTHKEGMEWEEGRGTGVVGMREGNPV